MSKGVLERAVPSKKAAAAPPALLRPSIRVLWLPFASTALLALLPLFSDRIGDNPLLAKTVWAASGILFAFLISLAALALRSRRILQYQVILSKVHYVQFTMHTCVFAYWGYYWREVYHYVPLLIAQIAFVYAFDMLLCWSRRDTWILGFGPIPIVLSTNLFLWFRDDWYYLQFLMLAVGVLGKEFIKWRREGRLCHIFNPSAFSLFIFSVVLIATRKTDMTWGIQIADTLHRPPHIYLEIFLLGLIVQSLFRVTLVTLFSAVALCAFNLSYTAITGDYNFIDSNIPVSVFLGLHLLVTDPATSPRRNFGKILFGLMYGAGVFGMYRFLSAIGAPEFYDKLLCVPCLNLTVQVLDRASDWFNAKIRPMLTSSFLKTIWTWTPQRTNLAWMSVWIVFCSTMFATGFLAKGREHPGGDPDFWKQACLAGKSDACNKWARTLNVICDNNSAAACLQVADLLYIGTTIPQDIERAAVLYGRACDLGSHPACTKLLDLMKTGGGKDIFTKACQNGDGAACFILGSLYSGGAGVPEDASAAFDLFTKSCDLGWPRGCGRLGMSYLVGQGTPIDSIKAIENFEKGCNGGNGASCLEAGKLYSNRSSPVSNPSLAPERNQKACELGVQQACGLSQSSVLKSR